MTRRRNRATIISNCKPIKELPFATLRENKVKANSAIHFTIIPLMIQKNHVFLVLRPTCELKTAKSLRNGIKLRTKRDLSFLPTSQTKSFYARKHKLVI